MTAFRTPPEAAAVHPSGWARLRSGVEVTRVPLIDSTTPEPLLARLTYRDAQDAARRLGGRLPTREEVVALISEGHIVEPVKLSWGPEMVTREHAAKHDRLMWQRLATWDGQRPVMGAGKHWIAGATGENVRICGWWDGRRLIQSGVALDNPHHLGAARSHHDYGTTTMVVREPRTSPEEPPPVHVTRPTLRRGDRGPHVGVWQRIIGAKVDEHFGAHTAALTGSWQAARGLVPDEVVGPKSWALAGETWAPSAPAAGDPRSPAAVAAIRDANARWPGRKKASDGIMGDARHQLTQSGHNSGNAVDITHDHDPTRGPHGDEIRRLALQDPRTAYVIWNGRITNPGLGDRIDGEGRVYTGSNPHTTHVHIEVRPDRRADQSPWPWAP